MHLASSHVHNDFKNFNIDSFELPNSTQHTMIFSTRRPVSPNNAHRLDHFAATIGWSQAELEQWCLSVAVTPHLRTWYNLCMRSPKRFAEGLEWTRTCDDAQTSEVSQMKDDVLKLCLAAQKCSDHRYYKFVGAVEDIAFNTELWSTCEIWARTVWRIVEDSMTIRPDIVKMGTVELVGPYGFVIELLLTVFTSIASRSDNSPWAQFIEGMPEAYVALLFREETSKGKAANRSMKSKRIKRSRNQDHQVRLKRRRPCAFVTAPTPVQAVEHDESHKIGNTTLEFTSHRELAPAGTSISPS